MTSALRLRDVQNGAYLDAAIYQDFDKGIIRPTGRICAIHEDRDYQIRLYGLEPNARYEVAWSYYMGATFGYCGQSGPWCFGTACSWWPIAEFVSDSYGNWFSESSGITWRWNPCTAFGICDLDDYSSYISLCFILYKIPGTGLLGLNAYPEMFTFILPNLNEICTDIACVPYMGCYCVKAIDIITKQGAFPWGPLTPITPDKPCLI